jgi:hypothetical protein
MIDKDQLGELEAQLGPFMWGQVGGEEDAVWHFSPSNQSPPLLDNNPQGRRKKTPKILTGFVALIWRYGGKAFSLLLKELKDEVSDTFPKHQILSLMRISVFPDDLVEIEFQRLFIICCRTDLDWTLRYMACVREAWQRISTRQQPELVAIGFRYSMRLSDDELCFILQRNFEGYDIFNTKKMTDRRERIVKRLRA